MEHRFGGVVIDTKRERVTIRGEAVHTTPRVFATLRVLVERAGMVVTREALLRDVWRGRAVDATSVRQAVAAVRRLLAGAGEAGRLRTIAGRGYLFEGPVESVDSDGPAGQRTRPPAWGSARVARVAGAIAAALVFALVVALAVGSRTSHGPVSGPALSVAQELDAGYREGRARLATRTGRDMRRAAVMFTEAVSRDPSSAPAWTALAETHHLLGFYGLADAKTAGRAAEAAASRAIALDPAYARAYAVRASVVLDTAWDLPASGRDFRRALDLEPGDPLAGHWSAWWWLAAGRVPEARAAVERAARLAPRSVTALTARATFAYLDGDLAGAVAGSLDVLAVDPEFFRAHLRLGLAHLQAGRGREALASIERAFAIAPDVPEIAAALAHARAVTGDRAGASRTYRQHASEWTLYDRAVVLTGLGRLDDALAALIEAREAGHLVPGLFAAEPRLAPLRQLAGYARLLPPAPVPVPPGLLARPPQAPRSSL